MPDETIIIIFAELDKFSQEKQKQYTMDTYSERDYYAGLDYAKKEGREEGREKRNLEVAANLKKLGIPIKQIATATGLSIAKIISL